MGFLVRHHQQHHRRGFSLTELAIVLGVAGTFLAGTWAAYGKVMKKVKINRSVAQLEQLITNLKKTFPRGQFSPYDGNDHTGDLIDAGVIPQDMRLQCYASGTWGGAYHSNNNNNICAGFPQMGIVYIHIDPGSVWVGAPAGKNLVPIWIGGIDNKYCPAFMAEVLKRIPPSTLVWAQTTHTAPTPENGNSNGTGVAIDQNTLPDVFKDCANHTGIVIRL